MHEGRAGVLQVDTFAPRLCRNKKAGAACIEVICCSVARTAYSIASFGDAKPTGSAGRAIDGSPADAATAADVCKNSRRSIGQPSGMGSVSGYSGGYPRDMPVAAKIPLARYA